VLFLISALALVANDSSPAPGPSPEQLRQEEGLAAQALEDLAAEGLIPGPPSTIAREPSLPPAPDRSAPRQGSSRSRRGPSGPGGVIPYRGLGTWVDVYDWSATYTRGQPQVLADAVDAMADAGVQTLYIQASKHDAPSDVLEPERLGEWIDRAHERGLDVVAWYLPTLEDLERDLGRMLAISRLPVDGLAVDIESKDVRDLEERNRRLVAFSAAVRQTFPGRTLGGIVLPPVVLEAVNPAYWPSFPYRQLAPYYDVWMTMGYWTNRPKGSAYRDAERYTRENVARLRANLDLPNALVHAIGGIGDRTTEVDVAGYREAVAETGSIGGSLYDWRTTSGELWKDLGAFRR
jgi:hypothetical protein